MEPLQRAEVGFLFEAARQSTAAAVAGQSIRGAQRAVADREGIAGDHPQVLAELVLLVDRDGERVRAHCREFGHALPAHGEAACRLFEDDAAAGVGVQVIPQSRDAGRTAQVGKCRFRERGVVATESDAAIRVREQRCEALAAEIDREAREQLDEAIVAHRQRLACDRHVEDDVDAGAGRACRRHDGGEGAGRIAVRLGGAAVELLRSR